MDTQLDQEFWRAAVKVAGALVTTWWLSLGTIFPLLLAAMLLDMASGSIVAISQGRLDKRVAWRGALKKSLVLGVVVLAEIMERVLIELGLPAQSTIGTVVLQLSDVVSAFYLWHEAVSILEHAVAAGLPVPGVLRRALARVKPDEAGGQ